MAELQTEIPGTLSAAVCAPARTLRLIFAANFARSAESGIGNHQLSLAGALQLRGHQVEILWADDFPGSTQGTRWSRLVFPRQLAREIERRVRLESYDAVNLHEPSGMTYARRRRRRPDSLPPLVITSHGVEQRSWDLQPTWEPPRLTSRLVFPLTRLTQSNYALRHADAVACLSSDDADHLQTRLGVPPEKIHRLSNGVDAGLLELKRQPPAEPRLLFIGTWMTRKGTRQLAAAFHALRQEFPWLRLAIAGAGVPAASVLMEFAAADRDWVEVRSRISRQELPALLASDQIFVLPSHFEGMPLSLLEAMAAGLPCVTTHTCGMRDVLRHGENGLLVQPGDALGLAEHLRGLLCSAEARQRLGFAARRSARQFTWDRVAEDWERMFLRVADEKKPAPRASRLYDQWHGQISSHDHLELDLDNPWHSFARRNTGDLRGARVLEAACGRGQFSKWLQSQGAQLVALDFSQTALRIAASRLNGDGRVALVCADAERIPCADAAFDCVVSCETLEHVPHPENCLREFARVLRPGGRLLLTTENYLNIWGLYRLYKSRGRRPFNSGDEAQPVENWMFSPQTASWIRSAGFRILTTDGEQHHLYLLPGTNPSRTEARFLSRIPPLRGLLKYFGRRFYVIAEASGSRPGR